MEINGKIIDTIIDTGAATNIMTDSLMEKLGLEIEKSSNLRCTMANGDKIASLGKTTVEIGLNDELVMPVQVNIIKSPEEEIILGNDTLKDMGANIDFDNKELGIKTDEEIIVVPIRYEIIRENEDIDEEIESDDEYEEDEQIEMYTLLKELSDDEEDESK